MAVGEEGNRVSTIMYTDYCALRGGRPTSVDVLEEENLVILVADCSFDFGLYYSIGEIMGRTIRFGQSHQFTTGTCPSVVVVKYDDNIYAIEAHNTHLPKFRNCRYNIWKLNTDKKLTEVDGGSEELAYGAYPKLCANTSGDLVTVYENSGYGVGKIVNGSTPTIHWTLSKLEPYMAGNMHDISMRDKKVVMVLKNEFSLKSCVSELNEGRVIWNRVVDVPGGRGYYPSISLNNDNIVLLCYQTVFGRSIILIHGENKGESIVWHPEYKTSGQIKGEYPTIVFNDNLEFFLVNQDPIGTSLRLAAGNIFRLLQHETDRKNDTAAGNFNSSQAAGVTSVHPGQSSYKRYLVEASDRQSIDEYQPWPSK